LLAADTRAKSAEPPKVRSVEFHYRFRVKALKPAGDAQKGDAAKDLVRVWLPRPSSSEFQKITRLDATAPGKVSETTEPRYGNKLLYFETKIPASGEFTVDVPYEVVRHEVLLKTSDPNRRSAEKLTAAERALFSGVDQMVPKTGKPLALLTSVELRKDKLEIARQLYDIVDDHVAYKKEGTGWGRGDVNWVCDSGFGNCTDFHSLFMSLARSQGLPARFEIGFSIPADKPEGAIAGYHCWAWFFHDERGWIPVDISEADKHPELKDYYFGNLTADRVMFSVGRDLELVPKAAGSPRNFLIYPHVEVGNQVQPPENIELQFTYKDK
jgi:hypothetical protein